MSNHPLSRPLLILFINHHTRPILLPRGPLRQSGVPRAVGGGGGHSRHPTGPTCSSRVCARRRSVDTGAPLLSISLGRHATPHHIQITAAFILRVSSEKSFGIERKKQKKKKEKSLIIATPWPSWRPVSYSHVAIVPYSTASRASPMHHPPEQKQKSS
ncbi:uncharacterized protein LY79DRAFT_180173 [Colletotrichum navitas]|uniref:Uncharacterized protein n=1 Tax=Colletotrichum navitas TaxID=681940 RepID=A0AAD8V5D5_9PEZI|nr:uncharacterized protein LY79DRAFT_180173 [Colletotrichum navitas]KAK1593509.1 hypothetical protein LY79DRAFT_180173 [Colletotrichum navitas]